MKIKSSKIASYEMYKTGELCCAICGSPIKITRFKNGYICDGCVQYIKSR